MTSIQFFYNRDFPGNTLQASTLQALEHLGLNPEIRATEAAPEHVGAPLPALAIDGEIVVSGVEPSVRELELLFEDHARKWDEDASPCGACGMKCGGMKCGGMKCGGMKCGGMKCGGMNGTEKCPMCVQDGGNGSTAGKIIGFAILLIILFLAVKILS